MTQQIKQRIEQIRRGEVPEGYKKTKIGIVPSEWENYLFSDLFVPYNEHTQDLDRYPLYSLTIEDGITAKTERYERSHLVKKEDSYKIVRPNDFAYNPMNLRFGAVSRHKGNNCVCVSGYYDIFTTKYNSDLAFMDCYLTSDKMITYYNKVSIGSLVEKQRVHFSQFLEFNLPLPNLRERERIAEILKTQDHVIELCEKKVEQLKKLKKVFLQKMFPKNGQDVPEWRFPEFTDAWEQRKVSDVAEITTGGTPSTTVPSYWEPKEIPWLSSGEVHKKYILFTDNKISTEGMNNSSARIVKENSVLIALAGQGKTRGTVAINRISLTTNQSIAAMTFSEDIVPEFVFCNMDGRYDEIRKMSSGDGARGGLNKQIVGDIEIPYTSKSEQEKIGCFFNNLDNLITLHQRKCDEEKQKKKALMQLLLTGIARVKV